MTNIAIELINFFQKDLLKLDYLFKYDIFDYLN